MEPTTPTSTLSEQPNAACPECQNQHNPDQKFCVSCGFPVNGTPVEIQRFKQQKFRRALDKDEYEQKIKSARSTLFVVAAVFGLLGSIVAMVSDTNQVAILVQNVIIAAIFAGLGFWSRQKPFAAILTGLIVFISLQVLFIFIDVSTIYRGIIMKVFAIIYLVKGLNAASQAEKMKSEENG